jgi:hypothetical protein
MHLFLVPSAPFRSLAEARLELGADGDGAGGGVSPPERAMLLMIECCQASNQQPMLWFHRQHMERLRPLSERQSADK